jgi:inorganic pyrophosphatase
MTLLDVYIEISKGSNLKYEYDKKHSKLRLDRVLSSSMIYPGNYGYIPNTLAEDNDELDALVIVPYSILPGTILKCRVIGALIMEDEKGLDEKIIVVPDSNVDASFDDINDITDLKETTKHKISHFFEFYKKIEKNKWSNVKQYISASEAQKLINKYSLNCT